MLAILVFIVAFLASQFAQAAGMGNVYWASVTGGAENCGSASGATDPGRYRRLKEGLACLQPGDTLYVKNGDYIGAGGITAAAIDLFDIPNGASWDVPVTVASAPGETAVLTGVGIGATGAAAQYIIFDRLVFDGRFVHEGLYINVGHHIRVQNSEIKNGITAGIGGCDSDCQFINLEVHHNGQRCDIAGYCHGIYSYSGDNAIVDGGRYYDNNGYGIHNYPSSNQIIRNVEVFNNRNGGVLLVGGRGNQVHNNTVYNNEVGGIALPAGENGLVYNNTVYGNRNVAVSVGHSNIIKNNIIVANAGGFDEEAANNLYSQNLCDRPGVGCSLIGDPHFANPAAGDFHLTSNSAFAIDQGTSDIGNGVTVQSFNGSAPDIGAYEFGASSVPLTSSRVTATR